MDPYCGWNRQKNECTNTPNRNPRAARGPPWTRTAAGTGRRTSARTRPTGTRGPPEGRHGPVLRLEQAEERVHEHAQQEPEGRPRAAMDPYCGWNRQKNECTNTPNRNP